MGKDQRRGVRALIYLSSIYGPALIGFSVIVLVRGCKSRLSISGDGQNTTCDTDAGGRGDQGGKRRPRFMFARKNMTLVLCCLSAQHLFHYRHNSYALFFCTGSLGQNQHASGTFHIFFLKELQHTKLLLSATTTGECPCPVWVALKCKKDPLSCCLRTLFTLSFQGKCN